MSTGDWIPFVALVVALAISALRALPYIWSPPADAPALEPPKWWPYTRRAFHAAARAFPALLLFFVVGAVLIPLAALRGTSPAWRYAYDACLAGLFLALALVLAVVVFNRPSLLIPPALRRQSSARV